MSRQMLKLLGYCLPQVSDRMCLMLMSENNMCDTVYYSQYRHSSMWLKYYQVSHSFLYRQRFVDVVVVAILPLAGRVCGNDCCVYLHSVSNALCGFYLALLNRL